MTLNIDNPALLCSQSLINGEWRHAADGRRLAVTNPASGELIAEVPDCTPQDAQAAVDAAQKAFAVFRHGVAKERAALLKRWHGLVMANQEDLARLMSLEQGKPLAESRTEVAYGASYIEWFAEEAKRADGDIIPQQSQNHRLLVIRQPVGVVAAITPWNFPMAMLARKIAPAIAAGCAVVCKPAEDTPLTALAMAKLLQQAGAPAGLINVLTTSRERAGPLADVWLADARVRKISFTGSTAVGKHLARESAGTLKRLSLELGGNAPFIVFDDADIDAAVAGLMVAKFRNAGQTCICPNRVYVQQAVYERFIGKLAEKVGSLTIGPAAGGRAEIGPLINARAVEKVEQHLKDALEQGARLVVGGQRHACPDAPNGHFFTPTVVADVTAAMRMSCEETFGPVVPVTSFATEAEVVEMANATPFGLAAYFYSRDIDRIWEVAEAIEAGMVAVNDGALSTEIAPFGGIKDSGYGREGSRYGLDEYMNIKYIRHGSLARRLPG
ncbi:NAD-dependent succinate-semialdehyde dehydrogenase [Noviherbaspirillum sp. L7-7A]|uniref:NAD-dependent succinate-semialdehyde dehydrogenase n=1 Tax=Noviherbaspirillum sp. L7-7A TaxID=2850560 RepID=UPI001C2C84FE|nr:NAD-dependent succinate-semialdehyde dehydrogenase [Noviherbaspirillum sp. L7-7A]MBV0882256.1 NAD-dependent succinate-semialdehyde dehydrogenase [Noviherbaspirillum sp. L7-7A]